MGAGAGSGAGTITGAGVGTSGAGAGATSGCATCGGSSSGIGAGGASGAGAGTVGCVSGRRVGCGAGVCAACSRGCARGRRAFARAGCRLSGSCVVVCSGTLEAGRLENSGRSSAAAPRPAPGVIARLRAAWLAGEGEGGFVAEGELAAGGGCAGRTVWYTT